MSNAYEIRHSILDEARSMLFEKWHVAMEVERATADLESRPPKLIPAPTVEEIKATAEALYEFVQKKQ